MSAHDIYHSQFDILGMLSTDIEKTERHAAQAPALRERYNKSSIFNRQSSIFNSPIKRDLGFAGTPAAGSLLRCDRLVRVGL
jgi:hypothetical protein